jgi:hypothetical protein
MKILFIGNSYTFYHEMPKLFEALCRANGKDVEVDSVTKGGRKLYENLASGDENNAKILELLETEHYDVLFLQEHSCGPLLAEERFISAVGELKALVGADRTILYETWGRKTGSKTLDEHSWTSEQMFEDIIAAYKKCAEVNGAELSRVGECFKALLSESDAELYTEDLSHPSLFGSSVAALSHYKTVFGEYPKTTEPLDLGDYADIVKKTVESV